jgi:hypothetical protein
MQRDAFEAERTLRREKTSMTQEMLYCFAPLRFRCTPSALYLGLGLFVLVSLVLIALLAFFLVPEYLVFEVLVWPRGRSVGAASVAPAGRRLLKGLTGLSFCGRVETNFDSFVFQGREEAVDAVGAAVGRLCVEESRVDEAFGDSLLPGKGLLAFESSNVGKS